MPIAALIALLALPARAIEGRGGSGAGGSGTSTTTLAGYFWPLSGTQIATGSYKVSNASFTLIGGPMSDFGNYLVWIGSDSTKTSTTSAGAYFAVGKDGSVAIGGRGRGDQYYGNIYRSGTQSFTSTFMAPVNPAGIAGGGNVCLGVKSYCGSFGVTIAGGSLNAIGDDFNGGTYQTIGGGLNNTAENSNDVIAGGYLNKTTTDSGPGNQTIGGGIQNTLAASYSVIGGGQGNTNNSGLAGGPFPWSVIGGGFQNTIDAAGLFLGPTSGVIGGGYQNHNDSNYGFIGGGYQNSSRADYSTIAGGQNNGVVGADGTIGGGNLNSAVDPYDTIAGGRSNSSVHNGDFGSGGYSFIGGGTKNVVNDQYNFVGGGNSNTAGEDSLSGRGHATIAGGSANSTAYGYVFIGGGQSNTVNSGYGNIGGGKSNLITPAGNIAGDLYGSIIGGQQNSVGNFYGAIGGGQLNVDYGDRSFIGGGQSNFITLAASSATISGGFKNINESNGSTIGGGALNTISTGAWYGVIEGGYNNKILSTGSVVVGGVNNLAAGQYSLAAGNSSSATAPGSFLWNDSRGIPLIGTVTDQFLIQAQGGFQANVSSLTIYGTTARLFTVDNTSVSVVGNYFTVGGSTFNVLNGGVAVDTAAVSITTNTMFVVGASSFGVTVDGFIRLGVTTAAKLKTITPNTEHYNPNGNPGWVDCIMESASWDLYCATATAKGSFRNARTGTGP